MIDPAVSKFWALIGPRHESGAFALLEAGYCEPHRAYHDWDHIADLLRKLDELSTLATRVDLIAGAIFWHDAVYVTREADGALRPDADNVRASAALFSQYSKFPQSDTEAIVEMILATIDHLRAAASSERYPGFRDDFDFFLDLDLSSLAAPWPVFQRNLARIRHEYGCMPEAEFCAGRLRMVEAFLAHGDELFRRPPLRARWLTAAQDNLRRSTQELRAQLVAGSEAPE